MKKVQLVAYMLVVGAVVARGEMTPAQVEAVIQEAHDRINAVTTNKNYGQVGLETWTALAKNDDLTNAGKVNAVKQAAQFFNAMRKDDELVSFLTDFLDDNPDLSSYDVRLFKSWVLATKCGAGKITDEAAEEGFNNLADEEGATGNEKVSAHEQALHLAITRGKLTKVGSALKKIVEKDLFANDSMAPYDRIKSIILSTSVYFARKQMSDAGKSFVIHDGINPLEQALAPLVSALNAPACAGLEEALRDLGVPVVDQDRDRIIASVEKWKELVLVGFASPEDWTESAKMVMGVAGYNAFVDAYNGTVAQ